MAKVKLDKVRITGFKSHYKLLMQELHRSGTLQIIENQDFVSHSSKDYDDHFGALDLARVEFAINFLAPYAPAHSKIESILSGGKLVLSEEDAKARLSSFAPSAESILSECEKIEDRLVRVKNEMKSIPEKLRLIESLSTFGAVMEASYNTTFTTTWIGRVSKEDFAAMQSEIAGESNLVDTKKLGETKKGIYLQVTVWKDLSADSLAVLQKYNFEPLNLLNEFSDFEGKTLKQIEKELTQSLEDYKKESETLVNRIKELSVNVEDLKILFDFNSWRKTKNDLQQEIYHSNQLFAFDAWIMADALPEFRKWIQNVFVGEVSVDSIAPEEGEEAPICLKNKWGIRSFQPVVEMYGIPKASEFDPTPFITPFFFVFFGLCLSDTGYGSILILVSTWFLVFGKFGKAAKDSLLLLLFCGISALMGGIILGGHFGLTPEQLPLLVNPETNRFYGQLLNPMEGSGPILFLSVALGLGALQLLVGLVIAFFQNLSNKDLKEAVLDSAAWFFFIGSLILFGLASIEGVASALGLSKSIMGTVTLASAGVLFVAQSIKAEVNVFLKPLFGIISLYNATSYLSDLLSYSRIMALGLATGVVGFAMNMTASILGGMMPHWTLGLLIGAIVILFGHSLNFGLSLLGAFIHSGRLQFIEFFGKFYEGGGEKFEPFTRKNRYLNLEN